MLFKNEHVELVFGGNMITLIDSHDWTPAAWCTVRPEGIVRHTDKDTIFVKNFGENRGMLDFLIKEGIIESHPLRIINMGHVSVPEHRLTANAITMREAQNVKQAE